MSRIIVTATFTAALIAMAGCSHPLRITDAPAPAENWHAVPGPLRLGFSPTEDVMLDSAIDEIGDDARVTAVARDFTLGDADVDYIVMLRSSRFGDADAQNFWITFPGFLIFTHAWLGYKYSVDIQTTSVLMDARGNRLSEIVIDTPYVIRHTSFQRGAAASLVGWFTPGYGVLAVIPGGISANSYDERADEDFSYRAVSSYRSVVADQILAQIAAVQGRQAMLTEASTPE